MPLLQGQSKGNLPNTLYLSKLSNNSFTQAVWHPRGPEGSPRPAPRVIYPVFRAPVLGDSWLSWIAGLSTVPTYRVETRCPRRFRPGPVLFAACLAFSLPARSAVCPPCRPAHSASRPDMPRPPSRGLPRRPMRPAPADPSPDRPAYPPRPADWLGLSCRLVFGNPYTTIHYIPLYPPIYARTGPYMAVPARAPICAPQQHIGCIIGPLAHFAAARHSAISATHPLQTAAKSRKQHVYT